MPPNQLQITATSDSRVLKLAKRYLVSSWPLTVMFIAIGAAILTEVWRMVVNTPPAGVMDWIAVVMALLLALAFIAEAVWLAVDNFNEVSSDGVHLLELFPFNEAGKSHLHAVLSNRSSVRVMDLKAALKAHYAQEKQIERERIAERRATATSAFQPVCDPVSAEIKEPHITSDTVHLPAVFWKGW